MKLAYFPNFKHFNDFNSLLLLIKMKQKDTILPYILSSMHPILHLSLLTTCSILHYLDHDQFYNIQNEKQCDAVDGSKAK